MRSNMKNIFLTLVSLLSLPVMLSAQGSSVTPDTLGCVQAYSGHAADLLRGQVAGVRVSSSDGNPLGAVSVDVRGLSTLRGDNQPLWIVDGAVIENVSSTNLDAFWNYAAIGKSLPFDNMFHISPYDIESIKVLSDASATALYGSRGAAGVIIVTTKKNRSSERDVILRSNWGITSGNLSNNQYVSLSGGKNKSLYNISLSYRNLNEKSRGKRSDDFSFRANFESSTGKLLHFGVNAIVGIGNLNNGVSEVPDYDDLAKRYAATASAFLTFNFTRSLSWTTTIGADYRSVNRSQWYGPTSSYGAPLNGVAGMTDNSTFSYNLRSELDFSRYFGKIHKFDASLGFELLGENNNYMTLSASDYYSYELRSKGVNYSNSIRPPYVYSEKIFHTAPYARLAYNVAEIAGLDLSARLDKTMNNFDGRTDFYPAASLWMDIRKLAFPSSTAVSALRIEGGWGASGNERHLPYPFFDSQIFNQKYLDTIEKAQENYMDARSFQMVRELHAGFSASFLKNRIGVAAKYYQRGIDDSFDVFTIGQKEDGYWKSVPRSLYESRTSSFNSNGIEAKVDFVPVKNADWTWTISSNAAYNVAQITSVNIEDVYYDPGYANSGLYTVNILGSAPGSIIGYEVQPDGYYKDQNGDNTINEADRIVLGNITPKVYGAVSTTLRYKWLTLDAQADFAALFNVVDITSMIAENRTELTGRYVSRGDYLRLSRIALGFDVPLKSRKVVKNLDFTLSAHNLATFSRYAGENPEVASFGLQAISRCQDYGATLARPAVMLGAMIKF